MIKLRLFLSFLFVLTYAGTGAQPPYAILIRGGHVIDPKNHIDAVMDVAVSDGKIVQVAHSIDGAQAAPVVDAGSSGWKNFPQFRKQVGLDSAIGAVTWNPAREIRHEELGHLSTGAVADIALLNIRRGKFGFFDYTGRRIEGSRKLECAITIRAGKIVYDLNGIVKPPVLPGLRRKPPVS